MTGRPDLTNSDEILPLARTVSDAELRRAAEELADGELTIRRLANRHGHSRLPRRSGGWVEICPDPAAHAADVAAMTRVLEACGLIPYTPARPTVTPDGCKKTVTNYTRPGR